MFLSVTESYKLKLKEELYCSEKEKDDALMKAKCEAKAAISKLNQQIVLERTKLFAEQQQIVKNLEEEFKIKESISCYKAKY